MGTSHISITKRQEVVRQLNSEGASQRQIAKAVGASQSQVRRDLSPKGSKSEPKRLARVVPPHGGGEAQDVRTLIYKRLVEALAGIMHAHFQQIGPRIGPRW